MDEVKNPHSEAGLQHSFHCDLTQHAHRNMKIYMNMEDQATALQTCCKDLLLTSTFISKNKKVSKIIEVPLTHCPDTCSLPYHTHTHIRLKILGSLMWRAISEETGHNRRVNMALIPV